MADAHGRPFLIIKQEGWKGSSSYQIQVVFADEPIQALGDLLQPIVGAL